MALPSSTPGGRPPYNRDPRRNNDPYAAIRRNHRIKSPQVRVISPEGRITYRSEGASFDAEDVAARLLKLSGTAGTKSR